jgi:hypothetical protein
MLICVVVLISEAMLTLCSPHFDEMHHYRGLDNTAVTASHRSSAMKHSSGEWKVKKESRVNRSAGIDGPHTRIK